MNKKIISLMLVLCTLFITSTVCAKEISSDDIPNNSYVIGTHLFTRETSGDYNGTLTIQYIMLAAQTINSNDINDMTIYYKNARGNWVNPLTGESVNISSKINIDYKDSNYFPEKISYGDVDCNGLVSYQGPDDFTSDIAILWDYLLGNEELTEEQKRNADINADGVIDDIDLEILKKYVEICSWITRNGYATPITEKAIESWVKYYIKRNLELEMQYPQSKFYDNGNYIFHFTLNEKESISFNLSTWNLYELDTSNNKNLIGTSKTLDQPIKVSIPVDGSKNLVIGVIYEGEELFINAGTISAKEILENNYPSFNEVDSKTVSYSAGNSEYTYTLTLSNDFDFGGDAGKYISGYELYEVKDNTKQLINSYDVDGVISNMKIKPNEKKVYVARAYVLNSNNVRIYSDYSKEFEVDANDFAD